jgi:transposase
LTPERRERIESELADGIPIAIVAQNLGVGRSTLHEWIANGRVTRRRRRRDPLRLVARPDVAPTDATSELEERLRAAESGLVAAIVRASQRGS